MKKYLLAGLFSCMLMFGVIGQAGATSIVHNYSDSWSVGVGDYYGYVAAQQWQNTQTNLTSVEHTMNIIVSGMTAGDDFNYRAVFATGWQPATYQFYVDESFNKFLSSVLTINKDYLFTSISDLYAWTNPLSGVASQIRITTCPAASCGNRC